MVTQSMPDLRSVRVTYMKNGSMIFGLEKSFPSCRKGQSEGKQIDHFLI